MYPYRMTGPSGGTTTGIIGALACEPRDGGVVPHEQTIRKDIGDRLNLLRACHANLSPIWGLSLTEGLTKAYEPLGPPGRTATDDSGTVHQLWVIDDPAAIESISQGVAQAPVVIADGHHRYETAVAYQAERRSARDGAPGDYDLVMAPPGDGPLVRLRARRGRGRGPRRRASSLRDARTRHAWRYVGPHATARGVQGRGVEPRLEPRRTGVGRSHWCHSDIQLRLARRRSGRDRRRC